MYLNIHDKVYTFYEHALKRAQERGILIEWIELALLDPDDIVDINVTRKGYDKSVKDNMSIRVIVDDETYEIVTVFFRKAD